MARTAPWQHIGVEPQNVSDIHELLQNAGLDWTVSLEKLYADTDTGLLDVKNKWATVRTEPNGEQTVISVVGGRYNVFQNHEIFEPFNPLVSNGDLLLAGAGELGNGALVYVMMQLPDNMYIQNDEHAKYLLARTSHDGTIAFQVVPTIQRLRCTNQISAAFTGDKSKVYSLKHTLNNRIDINEIYSVIQLAQRDFALYGTMANNLINIPMTDDEFLQFSRRVYTLPTKIENSPYDMLSAGEKRALTVVTAKRNNAWLVWSGETNTQDNLKNTKYGALQAIVEVEDHFGKADKSASKMLTSKDSTVKSKALELLNV